MIINNTNQKTSNESIQKSHHTAHELISKCLITAPRIYIFEDIEEDVSIIFICEKRENKDRNAEYDAEGKAEFNGVNLVILSHSFYIISLFF